MPFSLRPWSLLCSRYSETIHPWPCCLHPQNLLNCTPSLALMATFGTYSIPGTPLVLLPTPREHTLFQEHHLSCCLLPQNLLSVPGTTSCPAAYTPGTCSVPGTSLVLLPTPPEPTLFPVQPLSCCPHPRNLLCSRYNPLSCCLHPRNLLYLT